MDPHKLAHAQISAELCTCVYRTTMLAAARPRALSCHAGVVHSSRDVQRGCDSPLPVFAGRPAQTSTSPVSGSTTTSSSISSPSLTATSSACPIA